ncbi:MAG TPA: rod shape-determining protein RodA [Nostocaceae cyanobacterium]|nr:rod shape-determining protein RodA [Nostocaceae cyanobacterium]
MLLKRSLPKIRWQYWVRHWQNIDFLLFFLPVALSLFGGLMILSTKINTSGTDWWQYLSTNWWQHLFADWLEHSASNWFQHWVFTVIGIVIALIIACIRYENLLQWHWFTYGLINFSLIAVMLAGETAKGAQRWINVAGFNVQPSEFAKVGLIITLAAVLHKRTASTLENMFRALAITAIPWGLVFLQPDLATSLVFGAIVLGMLYWANAHPGWIILFVSPVMAAICFSIAWPLPELLILWGEISITPLGIVWSLAMGILGWQCLPWRRFGMGAIACCAINLLGGELGVFAWNHVLKEYQKDRLTAFINPEGDPLGTGYHLIQSRIAIGAGEVWGWGLFKGPMTQLNFVPEQHTDFIFSAVGEEFGFVGCLILLGVFCLVCLRLLQVAQTAKDNFGSLLAIGVLSMIVFQLVVNVGMTVGLAPVAGIPLPWMSYGRSAMLTNFIALGIVESVANFRQRQKYY